MSQRVTETRYANHRGARGAGLGAPARCRRYVSGKTGSKPPSALDSGRGMPRFVAMRPQERELKDCGLPRK
jgi:hypothetical protein